MMKLIQREKQPKTLAGQKRKNHNYDTYCIIIVVLIWYARQDSNL